jgi:4-carboxymuconolactone decarboxylase
MSAAAETPRLQPLQPPYEPDVAAQLAKWMPPGGEIEPLKLFRTLNLHPELASRMRPLGAGILGSRATVEPRLREVMIHRTCALTGAEYEWGVHAVAFGVPLGFSQEQLHSTIHGDAGEDCWKPAEALVLRLADELHQDSSISDELWSNLRARFDPIEIIELIVTAGWYHTIAYLCNGLAIEREPWAPRFPSR